MFIQNFRFKPGLKIAPCFIPIKIKNRIGNQAYKIILPIKYAQKHNIFPINLLEPWTAPSDLDNIPLPDLQEDQEVWEVENIKAYYNTAKNRRFLVKWKGWPAKYNIWKPEEHLAGAFIKVRSYLKRKKHVKWDNKK